MSRFALIGPTLEPYSIVRLLRGNSVVTPALMPNVYCSTFGPRSEASAGFNLFQMGKSRMKKIAALAIGIGLPRTIHFRRTSTPPSTLANFTIAMFGVLVRSLWFLLLIGTLAAELVPLSLEFEAKFSPLIFHGYEAAKLLGFFALGFLTPLAWWHSKSLGIGALFAIVVTMFVELGQALIPGHRASTLELTVKLVLLFAGLASGLDVRAYQEFTAGPLRIYFSSRYWTRHLLSRGTPVWRNTTLPLGL